MNAETVQPIEATLSTSPLDQPLTISRVDLPTPLKRKVFELGLFIGDTIELTYKNRSGKYIVSQNMLSIALTEEIAEKIQVTYKK